MKELEERLAAKVDNGHFRCKIKHAKIYEQMTETHRDNTSLDLLQMLNHTFDTQGVEAMNKSGSALAPKGETYSKTMSLTTRLEIACATQIIGHHRLWQRIYTSMGMTLGFNLDRFLINKDKFKDKRHKYRRSVEYKIFRKKDWNAKYNALRDLQMRDNKEGKTYEAGMALTMARSRIKEQKKKTKQRLGDVPLHLRKCTYHHPLYCTVLGHTTCGSKQCMMKGKSPVFLKEAKKLIENDLIKEQMRIDADTASKYCDF